MSYGEEHKKYEYELSVCAIFQNDATYLKEWIEFHKLVGVQHFYLINHFSTDHYFEVLFPYIITGEVELFHCMDDYTDPGLWNGIQSIEYTKIVKYCQDKTKWLALIDTDEFVFATEHDQLTDFLKDYEEFGGVYLFSQMFGTSCVPKIASHELLIEKLVRQSDVHYVWNTFGKSIVRPDRVAWCDVHCSCYQFPFYHVGSDKNPLPAWELIMHAHIAYITQFAVDVSKARINHYWTRDEDYLMRVKFPRYQRWDILWTFYERIHNLNTCSDYTIFKYVERLRHRLFAQEAS